MAYYYISEYLEMVKDRAKVIMPSNGKSGIWRNFEWCTSWPSTYIFKVKNFETRLSRKMVRDSKTNAQVRLLKRLIVAIEWLCLHGWKQLNITRWEWRQYECYILFIILTSRTLKYEYLQNGESWREMLHYGLYRDWCSPTIGSIANVANVRDLDLTFQGHSSEALIYRKRYDLSRKDASYDIYRGRLFAVDWHCCECCSPWTWPSFSRSNIFL